MFRLSPILKTFIFFAALTALFVLLGYFIGGIAGAILFSIFSIIMNFGMYWFSDKIAISMSGGREVNASDYPDLFYDVSDIAQRMQIKTPRIFVSPQIQPNAFATGRGPSNGVVCFTQGILNLLTRDELRGVIAHEIAHIKNRDVLIATIAATIAGVISSIAQIGIFFSSSDEDRNPVVSLLLMIFAPIAATLVQLAISRSREYLADEVAAKTLGTGEGLSSALLKIENSVRQMPEMEVNPSLSSLYIQNPLKGEGILQLFSTHPLTKNRIQRLKEIKIY